MDQRARDVIRIGEGLFGKKASVDSLWQEIALNFYPERADFTTKRNDGEEFADHLFSSYPVLARRELGNMLSEFLRPDKWFSIHVDDDDLDNSDEERKFLERLTKIQWRAMNDPAAGFVTATNQADHDIATFGNAVIKFGVNANASALLFRNYHLRDCVWSENEEGRVDALWRRWCPTARQLAAHFPDKVSPEVKRCSTKEPEKTIDCYHVVLPARSYQYKSPMGRETPYVSLYCEKESETLLEEAGLNYFCYAVPRWQTVANSVFGTSMSTSVVLPDGRTTQVVVRTLREAGEKHVDPPMIAVTEAIRGDMALYAGGVTTADAEYDERLGEVLRPITRDKGAFPISFEIAAALKEDIRSGFFLDKIQLPETNKDMTATEVRRRIQEHIRAAAPISKPLQRTYNHPLCDGVFQVLREWNAFPLSEMPDSLSEMDLDFKFRSPLDELSDQAEAETYLDVRDRILLPVAQIDPAQLENVDWTEATRDAMRAAGWKAKWFKPREAVAAKTEQLTQAAAMQKGMEALGSAGAIAEQGGKGMAEVANAEAMIDGA